MQDWKREFGYYRSKYQDTDPLIVVRHNDQEHDPYGEPRFFNF